MILSFQICWDFNCCIIFREKTLFSNIFIGVYYIPTFLKVFVFNISNHYIFNDIGYWLTTIDSKATPSPLVNCQQAAINQLAIG